MVLPLPARIAVHTFLLLGIDYKKVGVYNLKYCRLVQNAITKRFSHWIHTWSIGMVREQQQKHCNNKTR